jgi:cysteine desulfuration protein SufE
MSFEQKFEEIKSDFEFLSDWEEKYRHIIDLGKALANIENEERNEITKVKGCASQVWLISEFDSNTNKIIFRGDSDSSLVKGLLALMINLYSGLGAAQIIDNPPQRVFDELSLNEALTPNRANGLKSMANRMIEFAKSKL